MTQIVLQPSADATARAHYADTIYRPVELSDVKAKIPALTLKHLRMLFPDGKIPMWGVTPGVTGGNQSKWEKVELGALVLFSADNKIYGCGVVAAKFHNKALAKHLWGVDSNGATWEWMYALAEVRSLDISYRDFNKSVGYKLNYVIQGFNVLDETKSQAFMDAFDLHGKRLEWPPNPQDVNRAIKEFEELDRKFQAVQRVEQSALREHLLHGHKSGNCLLCGRTFHAHFLVAAHIKKRSECTDSQKRDLRNIGMLNCKFGCDELYERGYISVDGQGRVVKSSRLVSPVEREYMNSTVLTQIDVSVSREGYFAWHFQNQFKL
jgi:hypothetical protein